MNEKAVFVFKHGLDDQTKQSPLRFSLFQRRLLVFFCLTAVICLLLTACSETVPTDSPDQDSTVKLRVMRRESVFQPININPETRARYKAATGIDLQIEAVPSNNYSSKLKLSLSSENLPDIIEVSYSEMIQSVSSGRLAPLSHLIATQAPHFSKLLEARPELNALMIGDNFYAFPMLVWKSLPTAAVPILRMDVLNALDLGDRQNLTAPQTYDELLELLIYIKAAYPELDLWINRSGTRNLISNVSYPLGSGYSQSTSFYFEPRSGKGEFLYGPAHSSFKEVLAFLKKAYESGVLDPYYALTTVDEWQQKLSTGQALFFFDLPINLENFNVPLKKLNSNYAFAPLLNIKNGAGDARISLQYETHWLHNYYAISSKSRNIEAAVQLLDWLYSEEGASVANYGAFGTDYTLEAGRAIIHPGHYLHYKEAPFSFRLMQFERGTGQGFFTPYIDQTFQYQIQPQLEAVMDQIARSGMGETAPLPPSLTVKEAARVSELIQHLDAILFEHIDAYIIGEKSIDQFETTLMRQLQEAGSGELEEILNRER
ncbi:extracellular solute-binding protein [Acidaminobacter hydrogenoformans]|uniref:ABC-type glycerol-3-phosphate transport system, substrate-binding protein n=1 Tax=Acidaminobacter hydrogenoformans DSM 2784 TaxID=1120920 RepID=A0A1G5RYG7_9FIRM|nr:extracellular solute-binding protein [Acidaminobacter hydrogenoformans]SCZ79142.1 ABC-type glycerol-3-phosphate transport system, substrate-binding protein [Acidaminobacter hydrogenoformans DSM 2784]